MNKLFKLFSLVLICSLCVFVNDADAQRRGKKKKRKSTKDEYFDESGGFAHRLWYGGGFNLGFSGGGSGSSFIIGISPMVGYKITNEWSIGPRVKLDYNTLRLQGNGIVYKANLVNFGGGAFTRYKIFDAIFLQSEIEFENDAFIENEFGQVMLEGDKIIPFRENQTNVFIGAGYNSSAGGALGYELVLLYNLTAPGNTVELPIDFRFAITYNF